METNVLAENGRSKGNREIAEMIVKRLKVQQKPERTRKEK